MTPEVFRPITKAALAGHQPGVLNVDELCGPASVTMLLQHAGIDRPFEAIYQDMERSGSFVPGTGTYLQRAATLDCRLRYQRALPCFLLRRQLRRGATCAASIKGPDGNHIVFVCGLSEGNEVVYYDPNLTDTTPQTLSWKQWHQLTNHRVLSLPQ